MGREPAGSEESQHNSVTLTVTAAGTMVNSVTLAVTFTILSLQTFTSLADIFGNHGLPDYGDLDYNEVSADYSGGQLDPARQQQNQPQGSNKAHLKGGVLPAYCDPPNPCPKGYTAEDGCIEVEEFANEAEFSRNYQAAQSCMCDSEHMFTCPQDNSFSQVYGDSQDGGFSLFGLPELTNIDNPFLSGSKLPIAAKKGLGY